MIARFRFGRKYFFPRMKNIESKFEKDFSWEFFKMSTISVRPSGLRSIVRKGTRLEVDITHPGGKRVDCHITTNKKALRSHANSR